MFLTTKVLTLTVSPLGMSLSMMMLAGILFWTAWKKLATALLATAIAWLWLWSMPAFVSALGRKIEAQFPPVPVENLPAADAIVLLGGGVRTTRPPRLYPEVRTTGARVFQAARLYKAGKAPYILATGGPGIDFEHAMEAEAEATRTLLVELGVPEEAVLVENRSRNTRENALFSKTILDGQGARSIILVTSALHMPRAMAEFEEIFQEIIAGTTDYEFNSTFPITILEWVPSHLALEVGSRIYKELLGRQVQKAPLWF